MLAHELRRVEAAGDERFVQIHDEIGAPVVHGPDDDTGSLLLPAHPIREVTQLSAFHRLRLGEDDVAVLLDDLEVGRGLSLRFLRLLAGLFELRAQLVGLAHSWHGETHAPHRR